MKKPPEAPLSEIAIPKEHNGTKEQVLADLRSLAEANPEQVISRNWYRINGKYAESAWSKYFGVFAEFKRQANIVLSRHQHRLEKQIAKHASVDHYRAMNLERADYAEKYLRPTGGRFKVIVFASDLHDKEVDLFYMRVLIDTIRRIKPDVTSLVGDVMDLPEFGKYGVDPREWDVTGRLKYAHKTILRPIREANPDGQLDLLEGNHEFRLMRHLADQTPALRAVLSDLHGMTVSKLLGLDEFGINYVAKADLGAYTKRDIDDELRQNYRVYFDSVMAYHYPDGRNLGMPGVSGHHHSHVVWSLYNQTFGSYEWHQMGAGHKNDASYTLGEKWNRGFNIAHVDTLKKSTVFEYVHIADHAVVGGKYYHRAEGE